MTAVMTIGFEDLSFTSPLEGEVGDNALGVGAGRGVFAATFQSQPPSPTHPLKGGGDMQHAWQRPLP